MKHDQISERVCAVAANSAEGQMPVGINDTRAQHIGDDTLLDFVDELEDEFGLILDPDTIGEMTTLLEISDHIAQKLSLIHAH